MIDGPGVTRRCALATLAAAGLGAACRAAPIANHLSSPLDQIAEQYVRCTLGLALHQPSLVESWQGPEDWRPRQRHPVAELRTQIDEIRQLLDGVTDDSNDSDRVEYLRRQIDALAVAARRLSGETMRFVDEARASLGSDVAELIEPTTRSGAGRTREGVEAARELLAQRLPGHGPLHVRYDAFRLKHAVARERVVPALRVAIDACARRVHRHIPLPHSESVELQSTPVPGLEARTTYGGQYRSRMELDVTRPIDPARLVWLVAHEAYPGHHVQHVLADRDLVRVRAWQERGLSPVFGRHLLCAEGVAEAGAALLLDDEFFDSLCRQVSAAVGTAETDIAALMTVQRAVAELDLSIADIARAYLDGEIRREEALAQLSTHALVSNAAQMLMMIERQRTRLLAYPAGRRLASAHVDEAPPAGRWERLARVATVLTLPPPPSSAP